MIKIFPAPNSGSAIIDVLHSIVGPVDANADCLGCSVTAEMGEGGQILYLEQWRTKQALERHLRSQLFSRVLEAMEFSQVTPEIGFYEVSCVGGMELVELARTDA